MRAAARALGAALLAAALAVTAAPAQELSFDDLEGWARDDHAAALAAFRGSCDLIRGPEWAPLCRLAADVTDARAFFELFFRPVQIGAPPALFTGYYEPELAGSPTRSGRFAHPIYAKPPEMNPRSIWHSRAEIERRGLLRGRGLELAWLDDPVEAFFLQVQGSGRIRFPDGRVMRVGFAAKNNHPYRSIGAELVRRGLFKAHEVSARAIRDYVRRNPAAGRALLLTNPSFVFFRRLDDLPPESGPFGAMGRPVTGGRSIAVDPAHVPLGAPVWVEKDAPGPLRRLMVAQDTGTAIKGAQRADIFYGTGMAAGEVAGRVRDGGRMVVLMPLAITLTAAGR
ncbi:murein transglycosylase A [Ruixingdingia sedimenti]|uniref:peptidoglycan lytic exotransglycosylase n=1 Tax=Ruixingdingia sedimenti TaxID=3073604 RepID=A0ABU1F7Q4_9RHOB|nr:MltA domain-containing protein [Xinfangfangia sp. LG-4]MDR5652673.1 MltA domain-containing protein [Xinfangfangia sp. LG-4]